MAEAVEELAHPPDVGLTGQGARLQQIHRMALDPLRQPRRLDVAASERQLLGQIQDGDPQCGIPLGAGQGPLAGVAAQIVEVARFIVEYLVQRLLECPVGVEVIEGKPAAAGLFRQLAQVRVEGLPGAEYLQAGRGALTDGVEQVGEGLIAEVLGEVEIDPGHGVVQQILADPPQQIVLLGQIAESTTEPHVQQNASAVFAQRTCLGDVGQRRALLAAALEKGEHPGLAQTPAGLEQHGGEGDFLGFADGLQRVVGVCLIMLHGVAPAGLMVLGAGEFGLDGLIQTQHPTVITAMYAALALVIKVDAAHIINGVIASAIGNIDHRLMLTHIDLATNKPGPLFFHHPALAGSGRNNSIGNLLIGQIKSNRIGGHIANGLAGGTGGQQDTGQHHANFINEFHNIFLGEHIHHLRMAIRQHKSFIFNHQGGG
ncbi:hypothetical protein D3C72_917520 [compost metagenome]